MKTKKAAVTIFSSFLVIAITIAVWQKSNTSISAVNIPIVLNEQTQPKVVQTQTNKNEKLEEVQDKDMAELEKISQELLSYKNRTGDDPTKMTNKELEEQVSLLHAYNRQLKLVIEKYEKEL